MALEFERKIVAQDESEKALTRDDLPQFQALNKATIPTSFEPAMPNHE